MLEEDHFDGYKRVIREGEEGCKKRISLKEEVNKGEGM